ncbi:hypothetical protein MLD38_004117 [Melastoma candidum]|uniref:Uncharacterized protein n=1 Tax=Melastoma candidum TaxID=119954 RepID=A0ACB9S4E3_9MYRT|nr:hypothetical protein MLD38_004117 [Melastoma candidum]
MSGFRPSRFPARFSLDCKTIEAIGMEADPNPEKHLTSAAAFVEGGIQDACEDACSICLEAFCDSDPSTVTTCKHEYHLQCILEWCQRSSQCPMCWQPISLKDPASQELLETVERERSFRFNPSRNATIFHHPTLGDFELQHLPAGVTDAELEERIIQHLAAAAAMGRARHIARREGHRNRSAAHGRSHVLVFTHPNALSSGSTVSPSDRTSEEDQTREVTIVSPSSPLITSGEENPPVIAPAVAPPVEHSSSSPLSFQANRQSSPQNNRSPNQSSPNNQERGGPSDFQSFSENLKNRFTAVSNRCKESLSKSTRGWKERLFSRNTSVTDLGSEVRREVDAGIASVSRMMERLETRDTTRTSSDSVSNSVGSGAVAESGSSQTAENLHQQYPQPLPCCWNQCGLGMAG